MAMGVNMLFLPKNGEMWSKMCKCAQWSPLADHIRGPQHWEGEIESPCAGGVQAILSDSVYPATDGMRAFHFTDTVGYALFLGV